VTAHKSSEGGGGKEICSESACIFEDRKKLIERLHMKCDIKRK
jgi:hypothetical protein